MFPINEGEASLANRQAWDRLAQPYWERVPIRDDTFHLGPNGPDGIDLDLVPHSSTPLRILDVGCGSGANAVYLARQGHQLTGLDASAAQLDLARLRADKAGVVVTLVEADLSSLAQWRSVADADDDAPIERAFRDAVRV